MIKLAHESPIFAFDVVQELTDYDYFLVHLFEEVPEYFEHAVAAREKGRHIILDNSIFELGEAFDADDFKKWVEILKPTEYIVPDVLENAERTVANMQNWVPDVPGKVIGVVQGKTYDEICWCYKEIEPFVDKVAISFDYSYYENQFPVASKLKAWTLGRRQLLQDLVKDSIINTNKPHHLLGAALMWEFTDYAKKYPWIESLDTSNPVMWAIDKGIYPRDIFSIEEKPATKLFTLMNWLPRNEALRTTITEDIEHNVNKFRTVCNG